MERLSRNLFRVLAITVLVVMLAPLVAGCGKTGPASSSTTTTKVVQTTTQSSLTVSSAATSTATMAKTTTASTSSAAAARKPSGTLKIRVATLGSERWLPNQLQSGDLAFVQGVFDFLVGKRTPPSTKISPEVAEKWETSPDGLTWTFYLRKGIQFQDNWGELTSQDVKFSLELAYADKSQNSEAAYLRGLITKIDATDPYKVVITTKTADVNLIYRFTSVTPNIPIVSKKYVDSVGQDAAGAHPVGSGPYKFASQKSGTSMTLEALDSHWRQTPYFKTIQYVVVPEDATALAMLKAGDLDIASVSPTYKKEAESMGLRILTQPSDQEVYVELGGQYLPERKTFDPTVPWVGDPADANSMARALKVRQALNLAVNKQEIIDRILNGQGTLIGVLPGYEGMPWDDPKWTPYPYDPVKARQLLNEAGYTNGFTTTIWEFNMQTIYEGVDVCEAVATYWEKIGVKVNRIVKDYTVARQSFIDRTDVGIATVKGLPFKDELTLYNGINSNATVMSTIESKTVDALLSKARVEPDIGKRTAIYKELGQFYYDGYGVIPLYGRSKMYAVTSKVGTLADIVGNGYTLNLEYIQPATK